MVINSYDSSDNKPVINIVQDIATPHNNVLIARFKDRKEVQVKLWYAAEQDTSRYPCVEDLTHKYFQAHIYGNRLNWKFIKHCLSHRHEKFVIVGWMNNNTRLLHLLFFLLRIPFNHWTDKPNSDSKGFLKQKFKRYCAYQILKCSKAKIFAMGITTVEFFRQLGFPIHKIVNLPSFVEVDEKITIPETKRFEIFSKYELKSSSFVLVAGSRLIYEKGYDLLIRAVSLLAKDVLHHIKVIIVGNGPQFEELGILISELGLKKHIILEKWLAIDEFRTLIGCSHVFLHPARMDSYGGTTLGMAMGVPVIGSYQAGAAVDRISQGRNGFLYEAEDIQTLANFIELLYQNPELCRRMGEEARNTALEWIPSRGVEILVKNVI